MISVTFRLVHYLVLGRNGRSPYRAGRGFFRFCVFSPVFSMKCVCNLIESFAHGTRRVADVNPVSAGYGGEIMLAFIIVMLIVGAMRDSSRAFWCQGPTRWGVGATILLGVVGSFIGGFLGWGDIGKDLDEGAIQASDHRFDRRCRHCTADLQRGDAPIGRRRLTSDAQRSKPNLTIWKYLP